MAVDKSTLLIVEGAILTVCTITSIAVQLERHVTARMRIDASRWFLLIGACLALAMTAMVIAMATRGLGRPITVDEFARDAYLVRVNMATFTPYFLCNMFIKLSWLTFYYGLACNPAQNRFIHVMQFIAVAFGLSSVAVALTVLGLSFQPADVAHLAPQINIVTFFYCNATIMIVSDTVMYLMPIWLLRYNTMIRRKQLGIYILFAMGGIVVLASVLRLIAVYDFANSHDPSGAIAMVWFWAAVENHLGICIACAGALKQKYIIGVRKLRESWSARRSNSIKSTSSSSQTPQTPLEVFKSSSTTISTAPVSTTSTCVEDFSMRSTQSKCWFDGSDVAMLLDEEDARTRIHNFVR